MAKALRLSESPIPTYISEYWLGIQALSLKTHEVQVKIAQSCPTLCDPMDYSLPGSSVHGILQARILEWVAVPFSRGSSQPKNRTQVSRIGNRFITLWATKKLMSLSKSSWWWTWQGESVGGYLYKVHEESMWACREASSHGGRCSVLSLTARVEIQAVSAAWQQPGYLTSVSLILFLSKMEITTPAWTLAARIKWVNVQNCSKQSLIHNVFWGEDDWW